jgi:hypothetical protein
MVGTIISTTVRTAIVVAAKERIADGTRREVVRAGGGVVYVTTPILGTAFLVMGILITGGEIITGSSTSNW